MERKRERERDGGDQDRTMEERLTKAAIEGDVHELGKILREDKLILDKIMAGCFKTNPLHVAISRNQAGFVKELLRLNKDLAEVMDSGRSALHLAAAKGNIEIVKALIEASRDMCLARDPEGMNPVHVAAMKGNVGVLKELVLEGPSAARVKLERDETVLHLCVKHEQLKSLELLLTMSIGFELVNARDSGGNTILHLAVSGKNFDIVKHIVNYDHHDISLHHKRKKLEVNAMNAEGHTALDIALLEQTGSYKDFLLGAKCKKAKDVVERDWLSKKRDTLMVVASLIATMAFQAAVSPPAGVWQDNSDGHRAGEAVMAYNYPDSYPFFLRANTIAFVSSLSTILLLISDVPFKNRLYMWCLVVIMWLTVTSTAITYVFAIIVVTPKKDRGSLSNTIKVGVIAWCSVMALLLVYHTYKLIKDVWYDYKIKNESNKNITVYGYGDQDRSTGNSAQKPASYNYTVPKLLPSYDNANRQQEIQMVNNDAVQRD